MPVRAPRNLRNREKKFEEKGLEHKTAVEKKEDKKYPVGPWAMAFFVFVIVGSTVFQFVSMWLGSH